MGLRLLPPSLNGRSVFMLVGAALSLPSQNQALVTPSGFSPAFLTKTTTRTTTPPLASSLTKKRPPLWHPRQFSPQFALRSSSGDVEEECPMPESSSKNRVRVMIQDEIDLERAKARLGSYDLYVLVSVLVAAASFEVVKNATFSKESTIEPAIVLCAGLASLCGLHSTAVWALCALYGRSALGMKRDSAFQNLRDDLSSIRRRGFFTFSASLLLFSIEVGLLLLRDLPDQIRVPIGMLAATALYFIFSDWKKIYDKASILFTGEPLPAAKDGESR